MTGRRNIIIAVGAIVIFAAIVGFFITLDVSPQIAYARLFIDLGLVVGLVAVVMAFYRERPLPTENIIQVLKSLKAGKFKTRITLAEQSPLYEVGTAINELAKSLEMEYKKQEEIKRNLREELLPGIKQKEAITYDHSVHPELGPVLTLPEKAIANETLAALPKEQKFRNTLIESKPPALEEEIIEQDLGELYQRFIDAQRALALNQIEYPLFLNTVEKTRKDLISSYNCRHVLFDVVSEATQVALQPKIIR